MVCSIVPLSQWPRFTKNGAIILVANNLCLKFQGLQLVKQSSFLANMAMLFIDIAEGASFHTKNCLFPLEMIFLDKNFQFLSKNIAGPNALNILVPKNTYYVIEANPGWANKFLNLDSFF